VVNPSTHHAKTRRAGDPGAAPPKTECNADFRRRLLESPQASLDAIIFDDSAWTIWCGPGVL